MKRFASPVAAIALALSLAACSAPTRPLPYTGLDSSPVLRPSGKPTGRVPFEYSSPTDFKRYSKVLVEQVTIYRGADNQFEKVSEEGKRELARYMQAEFGQALQQKFTNSSMPGPGTLRIALTLTGAKPTKQFLGTFTKFDLGGGPYNVVQSIRGKEGLMSGSVSYAVEVYDSLTNELLAAYVAKQYPSAMNVKASIGALSASKTGLKKGAADLLARLDS
ncbi:DUF3313 domain-containing protein [Pinirhizobacter soli]|uniref:DUF3313 domain-containing protein n=1 Tax=Pinirhizobacter soli TaxID=2786953 RepID=UPI00202AACDD|nr:DUF3313 domain-containing protein [Pinirhizobacter soli]